MNLLEETLRAIRPLDDAARESARRRLDSLTKPRGSLGRLEEIAASVAAMTGRPRPRLERRVIYVLAADHGIARAGVSAYPPAVTAQMLANFARGGAAINALARAAGARVVVADLGVSGVARVPAGVRALRIAAGTENMLEAPAMRREQAVCALERGIALVEDTDLAGTGDMGIGNSTVASAITAAVTGRPAVEVTGRGTGIDDAALARKTRLVAEALARHRPDPADGLDILAKVGGFEIGGLAGVILGAAAQRIPVVLDGFISGAAALVAATLCPTVRGYLIAGHRSAEPGHAAALEWLGLKPILCLDMRLGEGTGAALAFAVVNGACRALDEMATFEEADVSRESAPE